MISKYIHIHYKIILFNKIIYNMILQTNAGSVS